MKDEEEKEEEEEARQMDVRERKGRAAGVTKRNVVVGEPGEKVKKGTRKGKR